MADAIVSALLGPILEKLTSRTFEEFELAWGLKTDLENLESTVSMIHAVLQDAEEKQWKSAAVKNWLMKLKDAAYDAEDVLDEFEIEVQRRGQQGDLKSQVRSFFSKNQNPIRFRLKMAHRLKNVREKLEVIVKQKDFHLTVGAGDIEAESFDWRQTWSLVNESEIYGRNREKEELINSLVKNSGDLSVYAICGMGGLGKTTLAQLIYNEGSVKEHFDLTIWVCVSDDSAIRRLARAMIESIEKSTWDVRELDPLQQRLHEKLSGKKFLLVLDDVWDEFLDNWSSLQDLLSCGAKGSAVLITTRIEMVALRMEPILLRHMERLSDDDSWLLFERFAFGMRRREDYGNLEAIGRAIVNKCGGVPLAIKALGKLMCLKKKESEWLSIKESEIWDFQEGEKEILPALRLSYTNLPPHLKQCFAFCSIFPKDHVIEKDRLIALWMANGFISCKGQMDLHDKGQEIFTELVGRSFFQEVEEDWEGNITCKMHDLMHDLAQSIMIHECCSVESNSELGISKTVRHVGFREGYGACSAHKCLNVQSLRSFVLPSGYVSHENGSKILDFFFSKQKHLRVLDIRCFYDVKKVSQSVCSLKQLRYLDVSYSSIKTLPESITSLRNLQTLNLRYCWKLLKLPKGMKDMKNLMYLDLRDCGGLRCMAAGMGQLTCLRKLSLFIVGEEKGYHIRELERLNYLGDELRIANIGNVKDLTDAKSANLMEKANLLSLSLSWHGNGDDFSSKSSVIRENMEGVLDGLQPHRNLKKLWIIGYGGSEFPNWMMNFNSLVPNLVAIMLEGCGNCEQLPPFGKLQFLKKLALRGMEGVKCIGSDVYGDGENPFPSLETLRLYSMKNLKVWATVTERESFPVLEQLSVRDCPVLVEMPIIPSLKTLFLCNVDATSLRNVEYSLRLSELRILSIPNLKLLPDGLLQNHTLLQHLYIYSLPNLESLSNQILDDLSSLKTLRIQDCGELESWPEEGLRNLNSLETSKMWDCHRLNSLPTNGLCGLSSLHNLSIVSCKKFASLSEGVRYLTALEDLCLSGCPELNTLPESIQHLTSLRSLKIKHCERLSSLPNQIGYLTSLSRLKIKDCPNLMSLPNEMQSLDTLKELIIEKCPDLEKRCVRERGEDWPKIAHIPNIKVNGKAIQGSRRDEDQSDWRYGVSFGMPLLQKYGLGTA